MIRHSLIACLIAVCCLGGLSVAASGPAAAAPRVAIMPLSNYSAWTAAPVEALPLLREELLRRSVDVADSAATAAALRKLRIRNAAELSGADARALADDLNVRYLLMGAVDRCLEADSAAEVALSARLLDAQSGAVVWTAAVNFRQDPSTTLLGLGRQGHRQQLLRIAAKQLVKEFRVQRKPRSRIVTALALNPRTPLPLSGRKIAVVTFGNESATNFAGHIVAGQLFAELFRRGFDLLDPGRVREIMIAGKDLMQGEISADLLTRLHDDLQADYVLTGTVSHFESARADNSAAPSVAFEARLVESATARAVWAVALQREGRDSAGLLDIGYCHSLLELSDRMVRDLVHRIPVQRTRLPRSPEPVPPGQP